MAKIIKKLLLTGVAALFLATGQAHAQSSGVTTFSGSVRTQEAIAEQFRRTHPREWQRLSDRYRGVAPYPHQQPTKRRQHNDTHSRHF
jgi:hypothetical protein